MCGERASPPPRCEPAAALGAGEGRRPGGVLPPGARMGEREGPGIWHGPLARCFCSAVLTGAGQYRDGEGLPVFAPHGHGRCWKGSLPPVPCPAAVPADGGPSPGPFSAAPVPRPPPAPRAAGTSETSATFRSPRAGGSRAVPPHPYSRSTAAEARASPPARCLRQLRVLPRTPRLSGGAVRGPWRHRCPSHRCGLSEAWHGALSGPEREDRAALSKPLEVGAPHLP